MKKHNISINQFVGDAPYFTNTCLSFYVVNLLSLSASSVSEVINPALVSLISSLKSGALELIVFFNTLKYIIC